MRHTATVGALAFLIAACGGATEASTTSGASTSTSSSMPGTTTSIPGSTTESPGTTEGPQT